MTIAVIILGVLCFVLLVVLALVMFVYGRVSRELEIVRELMEPPVPCDNQFSTDDEGREIAHVSDWVATWGKD